MDMNVSDRYGYVGFDMSYLSKFQYSLSRLQLHLLKPWTKRT